MSKLGLIIKREYLSRVTRKTFILTTLLTPLGIAAFMVIVTLIFSYESDDVKRIAVLDEGNVLNKVLKDEKNLYFKFEDRTLSDLRQNFKDTPYDAILRIPAVKDTLSKSHTLYYYSDNQPTPDIEIFIRQSIGEAIRNYKIDALHIDRKQLAALDTKVELEPEPISETGTDTSKLTAGIAAGLGMFMGMIMYMAVFIYGMMIMRGVMEEKMNRIVEVMISSVKPFTLMLGKIIGVGAVGITQLAIWALLIPLITSVVSLFFPFDPREMSTMPTNGLDQGETEMMMQLAFGELFNMNWALILPLFLLYFLGGYILYSAMFAAVGSAIGDDMGESQTLTLPIVLPVILAVYIMIVAIRAPNSSLAVWSSIFPLFSPIVMPARLAFNPPWWQVALSLVLLFLTSVFLTWVAGRIYRVGILMYGKKATFKELGKWLFYKD